jgi:hypothetical protein
MHSGVKDSPGGRAKALPPHGWAASRQSSDGRDTRSSRGKFITKTQNAAKPIGLVLFEHLVVFGTLGSLIYLLFRM